MYSLTSSLKNLWIFRYPDPGRKGCGNPCQPLSFAPDAATMHATCQQSSCASAIDHVLILLDHSLVEEPVTSKADPIDPTAYQITLLGYCSLCLSSISTDAIP